MKIVKILILLWKMTERLKSYIWYTEITGTLLHFFYQGKTGEMVRNRFISKYAKWFDFKTQANRIFYIEKVKHEKKCLFQEENMITSEICTIWI